MSNLSQYRGRLIDLSLRNKLVNYRPGRAAAIPVIDADPRAVVARLLDEDGRFRFRPRSADGEAPPARPAADELQTALAAEDLERILYNLYLKSRTSFEEQGVVSLFLAVGMLRWYESESADQARLAPILLVPAAIEREGVGRRFTLVATADEPEVNPSLLRKLLVDFGAAPALPPLLDGADPTAIFAAFEAVRPDPRWSVRPEIHLGLFSFSKYLLYKDLEDQAETLAAHPIVARLTGEPGGRTEVVEPPDPATLDTARPPAEVHQILDADSSQQVAIETVRRGGDLVLEGPPGTGKSQTIANLIAEMLAEGKTVLFVSEKMAALEVVKRRLDAAGLGDYVLELHSRHASKASVIAELRRCLERERAAPPAETDALARLAETRGALSAYVHALHDPFGAGGSTPYESFCALAERRSAPDVAVPFDAPEDLPAEDRRRRVEALRETARARAAVAPIEEHPFQISGLADVPNAAVVALKEELAALAAATEMLAGTAGAEAERLGLPAPADFAAADRLAAVLAHLAASPRPEPERLADPAWSGFTAECRALAARGRRYAEGRAALAERWTDALYDLPLEELADRTARRGILRFLRPSHWRDRKTLRAVARPGPRPAGAGLASDLARAIETRDSGREIDRQAERAAREYGRFWAGRETDFEALDRLGVFAARLRELLGGAPVPHPLARAAAEPADAAGRGKELAERIARARAARTAVEQRLQATAPAPDELAALTEFAKRAHDRLEELHRFAAWRRASAAAAAAGLAPFLAAADAAGVADADLSAAYERAFHLALLDRARAARPALRDFDGGRHEEIRRRFRELDRAQLALAAARIRAKLDAAMPSAMSFSPDSDVGLLLREAAKKRRHLPLRTVLSRAGAAVLKLKPCFMMSPLSVAQYLPPDSTRFDLVVFDEASQICPEDAIGAVARGRRLVVVGDSRQLPPTPFFAYDPDVPTDPADEENAPPDLESILDLCVVKGLPRSRLRWHYRSRDESLIAFSNQHFYDGSLLTFPGPGRVPGVGLEFVHVPGGVYDRGKSRTNRVEAAAVAARIAEVARAAPDRSVGVVAFSDAQRLAVLSEVERLAAADPALEEILASREDEPFFVKNLENVQGDERDVMFFSIGYGRDAAGKLSLNFGPLNGEGGHRRLNVAVTRARERVVVCSSILPEEIDPERAQSRGAKLLRSYLEYARAGAAAAIRAADAPGSPVDGVLADALASRGFIVRPRVGSSTRRVDLAVARAEAPEQFVLGLEGDGPGYRDAPTARDRDRLGEEVLARLGWRTERYWTPELLRAPERAAERFLAQVPPPAEAATGEGDLLPPPAPPAEAAPEEAPTPISEPPVEPAAPSGNGLPEALPWRPTPKSRRRPRREFGEDPAELEKLVAAVVAFEGPVHREEVLRRVADSYGLRLAPRVRETLSSAIGFAAAAGSVERRGDFLWPNGLAAAPVRGPAADGAVRAIEHVPDEEIESAAAIVLSVDLRLPKEALVRAVARLLGYRRQTDALADRIATVLAASGLPSREGVYGG